MSTLAKTERDALALLYEWRGFWARPDQLEPGGDWRIWLILTGRGWGKALALNTPLPTPTGWTTMGEVQPGDQLFDEHGRPCTVTYATDIQYGRECFNVVFDDGTAIVADGDHQWQTITAATRKATSRYAVHGVRIGRRSTSPAPQIVSTREMAATLHHDWRTAGGNHAIAVTDALELPSMTLPVSPYVLGVWLGDGNSAAAVLTTADTEMVAHLESAGCAVGPAKPNGATAAFRYSLGARSPSRAPDGRMQANGSLHSSLRALGLLNAKHIPDRYLRASQDQREALLQGLMDTDGSVEPIGRCEYCSMNERLATDVVELVLGLGFKATLHRGAATLNGVVVGVRYRIQYTPHRPVFRLTRKLMRQHSGKTQRNRTRYRYVRDVRPVASVPVRCIQVDSPSHLFLAGRAMVPTHNTKTGAEWVREKVERGTARRIALVSPTPADARDVMVEGPSGILNVFPPTARPLYEPSKRRVTFTTGATATVYSGADPEQLRGPQHDLAWVDELAAFDYPDATWHNLRMGMRDADDAKTLITTTPKPISLLRQLVKARGVRVTVGSTYDNLANLPTDFLAELREKYEGTTLGQQEIHAALLDEMPGALWKRETIERTRVTSRPAFVRVIVAIDPAVTASEDSSETGIVVAGLADSGHVYVLADVSGRLSPDAWARRAAGAFVDFKGDRVIGEENNGGELVRHTLLTVNDRIPYKSVRASDGKHTRAEPIAALYEQGRVHHVGAFPALEDQMVTWVPGVPWNAKSPSPDRMDALVWAVRELVPAVASIPNVKIVSLVGVSKWL